MTCRGRTFTRRVSGLLASGSGLDLERCCITMTTQSGSGGGTGVAGGGHIVWHSENLSRPCVEFDGFEFDPGEIVETESAPGKMQIARIVGLDLDYMPWRYYVEFLSGGPDGEWPVPATKLVKVSPLKALAYLAPEDDETA